MTITTEELRQPVPLREYLEAGLDPAAVGLPVGKTFEDELITILVDDRSDERCDHAVAVLRWQVTEILEGRDLSPGMFADGRDSREHIAQNWGSLQRFITAMSWTADLLEAPDLVGSVVAHLTETERADLARKVAASKAPNPLVVGPSELRCTGCGSECGSVALSVGCIDGWSSAPDEGGPWCFSCVTMAYEAMKAAHG